MATEKITLTIDGDALAIARDEATRSGVSLSAWVSDAVTDRARRDGARAMADLLAGPDGAQLIDVMRARASGIAATHTPAGCRVRQGQVLEWRSPAGPLRVLVLSQDTYSASGWPVCAAIVRAGEGSPYVVPLADPDPVGGRVVLGTIAAIPGAELGEPVGMVTGATWDRVQRGLRLMLGL
jgi:mRNA interferase MazF